MLTKADVDELSECFLISILLGKGSTVLRFRKINSSIDYIEPTICLMGDFEVHQASSRFKIKGDAGNPNSSFPAVSPLLERRCILAEFDTPSKSLTLRFDNDFELTITPDHYYESYIFSSKNGVIGIT